MSRYIEKLIQWYNHPMNEILVMAIVGSCLLGLLGLAVVVFLHSDNIDILSTTPYRQR